MARLNLVLALIAALALALAAPAFAYGDNDHDHSSPAPNSAPDSPWACTAVCPDQGTEVRPSSLDLRNLARMPVCLIRSARVGFPAPLRWTYVPLH